MNAVLCPHCKNQRIATSKVPKDVVVVMPCPSCRELVVVFHEKAIALSRTIMENGTVDERKAHLANIIVEFLEPGMFDNMLNQMLKSPPEDAADSATEEAVELVDGISDAEVELFRRHELRLIDNSAYFRKYFG